MKALTFRPATEQDAISLAPRLRPEDTLELFLANGMATEDSLKESVAISTECTAACEGDVVVALYGFCLIEGTTIGAPWLVCAPELLKHRKVLVTEGKASVQRWAPLCTYMTNFTHADNHVHHSWLRHIGFTFMPEEVPMGASKAPFLQFYRHS